MADLNRRQRGRAPGHKAARRRVPACSRSRRRPSRTSFRRPPINNQASTAAAAAQTARSADPIPEAAVGASMIRGGKGGWEEGFGSWMAAARGICDLAAGRLVDRRVATAASSFLAAVASFRSLAVALGHGLHCGSNRSPQRLWLVHSRWIEQLRMIFLASFSSEFPNFPMSG